MTAAKSFELVSVEDYLAGELVSTVKHEYIGGVVHAMAGGTVRHGTISGNVFAHLHGQLRGKRCKAQNSDIKIHAHFRGQTRFYYPDTSVVCESNDDRATHQDHPVLIVEVLSRKTRRIDEGEKCEAYLAISSLAAYILIEQEVPAAKVYRRIDQSFEVEVYRDINDTIELPKLGLSVRLAEVYENATFGAEVDDE